MYEVNLPTLNWFLFGNVYTGSFRSDLTKGCLCQTVFNFKVKLNKSENENSIIALCWYSFPWNVAVYMSEGFVGEFAASEFGIEVCENWIKSKFIQNYPLGIESQKPKYLLHQKRYIKSCNINL